jgi:nifR3 family TIM-barrel protein
MGKQKIEGRVNIGNLQLGSPLILAPMAGISDYPFRKIAKEKGCGLSLTGMISAEGLLRKGESFLRIGVDEHPVSVQLFGSDPEFLSEAAQVAGGMGADAIDINMGCPVDQVVETGAGVALMQFPEKVRRILAEVRKGTRCPLTIKIRSGWDLEHMNAVEISKIAEDCGIDAIFIHPRTKVQRFHGQADWRVIGEVKKAVRIPVFGNGDVTTPFLAKRMMEETGCDGVMIGRGALGNPWIFSPGNSGTSGEKSIPFPSLEERQRVIGHHFSLLRTLYGEEGAMQKIRRNLIWYTKGLPFSASFRLKLSEMKEQGALFEGIASYFDFIRKEGSCPLSISTENESVIGPAEKAF